MAIKHINMLQQKVDDYEKSEQDLFKLFKNVKIKECYVDPTHYYKINKNLLHHNKTGLHFKQTYKQNEMTNPKYQKILTCFNLSYEYLGFIY